MYERLLERPEAELTAMLEPFQSYTTCQSRLVEGVQIRVLCIEESKFISSSIPT